MKNVLISHEAQGLRLDKALHLQLPLLSRTKIKELILNSKVFSEGTPITDPSFSVSAEQSFWIEETPVERPLPKPDNIPLDIVYEDAHLAVINKQAGLVVHPGHGNPDKTLVNALVHHFAYNLSHAGGQERPGIVHRLDRDTSGLMVIAKTDEAHIKLAAQFADHSLKRTYWAFAMGELSPPTGSIHANIGRHPKTPLKMSVHKNGGKPAITHYKTLESFLYKGKKVASLLSCSLETGRTHQIRVHLSQKKCPIIGDALYGRHYLTHPVITRLLENSCLAPKRHALHAKNIEFFHPFLEKVMHFETALPQDLCDLRLFLEGLSHNGV